MDSHPGGKVRAGVCYHVGGNTKLYGAALFRLRERDFEKVQHLGTFKSAAAGALRTAALRFMERTHRSTARRPGGRPGANVALPLNEILDIAWHKVEPQKMENVAEHFAPPASIDPATSICFDSRHDLTV